MWHNQDYKIINDSLGGIIKAINNLNKTLAYTNRILSDQQKPEIEVKEDNFCEWKMDNVGASIGCRSDFHHTGYVNERICPFCKKRIKVIDQNELKENRNEN